MGCYEILESMPYLYVDEGEIGRVQYQMTPEEKRAYSRQYRADGYGANSDARYRQKNRAKISEYMREYMREYRKRIKVQGCAMTRKGRE